MSDKRWDTSSIEAMEETAKGEADHCCAVKIRGHWLEVRFVQQQYGRVKEWFEYRWGKNRVTRQDAIDVHKTK